MAITQPIIFAALITGIFGCIGALISVLVVRVQVKTTKKIERELKEYEVKLQVGTEVHLRLYERSMEEIEKYRLILKDVHLKLGNYKNGVHDTGLKSEIEGENTRKFYDSWNELRFPGVYVPTDIAVKLDKIKERYHEIKCEIYEIGKDPNQETRASRLIKLDPILLEMERESNKLVSTWKNKLLSKDNILEIILSKN